MFVIVNTHSNHYHQITKFRHSGTCGFYNYFDFFSFYFSVSGRFFGLSTRTPEAELEPLSFSIVRLSLVCLSSCDFASKSMHLAVLSFYELNAQLLHFGEMAENLHRLTRSKWTTATHRGATLNYNQLIYQRFLKRHKNISPKNDTFVSFKMGVPPRKVFSHLLSPHSLIIKINAVNQLRRSQQLA